MRRCVESGQKRFGMCVGTDDNAGFASVGTLLRIREFEQLPDGRSRLDCVGDRRFRVTERTVRDGD